MKLKEVRDDYYHFSGKVSDLSRNLCFSGIAVIWILRTEPEKGIEFDRSLLFILGVFVVSLALDLAQFLTQTIIWGVYNKLNHIKGVKLDQEVNPKEWFNGLPLLLFWAKVFLTLFGQGMLINFIAEKI